MPMSSRKLTGRSWKALASGQSVQTFQLEQKGMLNTFVSVKLAEACGSRTQTLDSQLTANDDVAASAKFQLESIGVNAPFKKPR
jgi:hypothetical protein